jgi:PilZ domain-containing protein
MNPLPPSPSGEPLADAWETDRRDTQRSPCDEVRPVRLLARPSFQSFPAFIREFSRRGVGLIFMRPLEPGTLLAMQLRRRQAGISDILTAQVRHATPLGDRYWAIGCRLSRSLTGLERLALQHGDLQSSIFWTDVSE